MAEEYAQAREDIRTLGPLVAYERSQQRQDQRLASAEDASSLACKEGCSWCCHFTIDLRPVEIFRILQFVDRTFDGVSRERLRARLAENRNITVSLDEMQRMQRNIQCPFLVEGRCGIYEARPQTCRNYHATNAAGCQKSFEEPDNLEIDPEFAPIVYQTGGAHVEAFAKAMRDEGYDVDAYEMNIALSAALESSDALKRFLSNDKPFSDLSGDEVPPEFEEEDES